MAKCEIPEKMSHQKLKEFDIVYNADSSGENVDIVKNVRKEGLPKKPHLIPVVVFTIIVIFVVIIVSCSVNFNKPQSNADKRMLNFDEDALLDNYEKLVGAENLEKEELDERLFDLDDDAPLVDHEQLVGAENLEKEEGELVETVRYSKVMVAMGHAMGYGRLKDIEIIDLMSPIQTCKKPKNFPYASEAIEGELGFENKPIICGGAFPTVKTCYTLEKNEWTVAPSLKEMRFHFALSKFPVRGSSVKLLASGGNSENGYFNSTEELTENGWVQSSIVLPIAVDLHCLVPINSSTLMLIGGYEKGIISKKTFFYSIVTNTWTTGPDLNIGRSHHSCALIPKSSSVRDKAVIVIGGYSGSEKISSVEFLQEGNSEWQKGPDLPLPLGNAAVVDHPEGGVVLIGGKDESGRYIATLFWLKNLDEGSKWIRMSQTLKMPRESHTAFLIPDGYC